MSIQFQIIYWRDIPTHLRLRQGRTRQSHALPEIFQKTVYRAAYRGKAITGDAYQDSWRTEGWFDLEQGRDGKIGDEGQKLEDVATALAEELVANYDEERLNALALNKGYDPAA